MFNKYKPKLDVNHYEGLITVFAVIVAVVYSSDKYDYWDLFIGILITIIGFFVYLGKARKYKDLLYSILTVSLISLGLMSIFNAIMQRGEKNPYFGDDKDFIVFVLLAICLYFSFISCSKKE